MKKRALVMASVMGLLFMGSTRVALAHDPAGAGSSANSASRAQAPKFKDQSVFALVDGLPNYPLTHTPL